jgi:pimeloyl-ACP methyl ester carboxylesterase
MVCRLFGRRAARLLIVAVMLATPSNAAAQAAADGSFSSNGVTIHYLERGRGEPVVLLHGFTGSASRHWDTPGVMEALEKAGYRALAMDCRGHGQSGKPQDASQYGLEMVADVVRFLDHLKIDRAHIVGYSMGGAIVTQMLVKHPGRVLSATLLGAGWEGEDLQAFRSQMQALADGFAKGDATPLIRAVASGQDPSPEQVAALNASLFARNDPQALSAAARGMAVLFEVPKEALRGVTLPVLAVVGEHDAHNVESVKRLAAVMPKTEIVVIPAVDHATSVRPSAPHITAFLAKHRGK